MVKVISDAINKMGKGAVNCVIIAVLAMTMSVNGAHAGKVFGGEKYIPGIWIDPDGCEHWVMDDGAEGYMDNNLRRDGTPVCHKINTCAVLNTDQLFATDSSRINAAGRKRIGDFFTKAGAVSYGINGHTDSRASDGYNMRLSLRRAKAVARVAESVGAKVVSIRGYGERKPRATNATAAGMQQNRRVEIMCYR